MEERSYTIKNQKLKGTWVIYIYGIAFVLLALKYLYAAVLFALAAVAITTKYKMDNENKSAMCVNLAIKNVAAGKVKEAKEYLQWSMEHNKLNKDAYLFYGSILFDEQDYTNALEYFKLGGIDKIEDPKVAGILGECYFNKENYDLAIKYLEMIEYPENSDFEKKRLYTIGRAYSEAKMYEKSLNALNKVPRDLGEITSDNVEYCYYLGVNYYYLDDLKNAKKYLDKVSKYDSHYKFVDMYEQKL